MHDSYLRRSMSTMHNVSLVAIFIGFFFHFAYPLSFSIPTFDQSANGLVFDGDAKFSSGEIALNPGTYFDVGHATYSEPLHLYDNASGSISDFTTYFTLRVDYGTSYDNQGWKFSDGIAFFLAPVGHGIPPNSGGGELGLFNVTTNSNDFNTNKLVTVEFDSWGNDAWDPLPVGPHVGININEISSVRSSIWSPNDINNSNLINAWVAYNASVTNLSVSWNFEDAAGHISNTTHLNYQVDLTKILPEKVTVGFSASAGLFLGRHFLCSWTFDSSSSLDQDVTIAERKRFQNERNMPFLVGIVVATGFVLVIGAIIMCWLMVLRNRRRKYHSGDGVSDLEKLAFPKRFSYQELVAATNGFAHDRRLGQGGSGQVYKGILKDFGGCTVAVKRIFARPDQKYERVFINEVKIISRLIHRNLVQFIGWCHERGECLLVYAYMPNTSLDTHLFGPRPTLQWRERYKIALGLASALHYLHEDAEQCVLHRDVKSANVLLDDDFGTKLGDFGIAKLVDPLLKSQTRGVVGTFGYMAPEYATEGRASKESDMFSFGVVALEIACGRMSYQDGDYHLPLFRWVWRLFLEGKILDAADERLENKCDLNEMKCLLIVGLWCTNPCREERPKAGEVMKVIKEAALPELKRDMHIDQEVPQYLRSQIALSTRSDERPQRTSSTYLST